MILGTSIAAKEVFQPLLEKYGRFSSNGKGDLSEKTEGQFAERDAYESQRKQRIDLFHRISLLLLESAIVAWDSTTWDGRPIPAANHLTCQYLLAHSPRFAGWVAGRLHDGEAIAAPIPQDAGAEGAELDVELSPRDLARALAKNPALTQKKIWAELGRRGIKKSFRQVQRYLQEP